MTHPVAASTAPATSTTERPSVTTRTVSTGARSSNEHAWQALLVNSCANSPPISGPLSSASA
ncbi:hypothetical protein [Streptomyces sp. NPDC088350]|uniref:hypothetical protein n=1 Tax=Streptomyces sp. NPDC088350 TaxID=3365854 RepID=UPI003816C118